MEASRRGGLSIGTRRRFWWYILFTGEGAGGGGRGPGFPTIIHSFIVYVGVAESKGSEERRGGKFLIILQMEEEEEE